MPAEWTNDDADAAYHEGWGLFECDGSLNGPWQIQRFDDPDTWPAEHGRPYPFDDDTDVWRLIRGGNTPLHRKALDFLIEQNPQEYASITGPIPS